MQRLERYIFKGGERLRMGYTTGSCAAGAARAAADLLLGAVRCVAVSLCTPSGVPLLLDIEEYAVLGDSVRCAVRKDAGDDPDVTDGATVLCTVSRIPAGIEIDGGAGVGRVTKPGLACSIGEAAINPVPRDMIAAQLRSSAAKYGYGGGLRAVVSVAEGEALAARTFNSRLGIVGGISILGTTGIVEPMSDGALVATIRAELDSLAAAGERSLLLVPGNYGRAFARERWGLDLTRGSQCSNFIGEALDYAVYKGFGTILLLGHAGKLVKLAAGIMNTHSAVADGRMEILAAHCGLQGLPRERIAAILDCVTVDAADQLLCGWGAADAVWASVGRKVGEHLRYRVGPDTTIGFGSFGSRGLLMGSDDLEHIIEGEFL